MASIRVGVMTSPRHIEIREVEKPKPGPGEVLVKIEACAVCTTEQRIYSGVQEWNRFPYVGGHEAAGVVESIGPGTETDLEVGDHVAILSATCGYCHNCRIGRTSKCSHRQGFWKHAHLWGTWGFADYRAVRPRGLQLIEREVPLEQAALTEPLSCVVHGARKAGIGLADYVVVIGAGAMGLLNLQVFKAMGAIVVAVEIQEERCCRALKAGADHAYTPDEAVERVDELTRGYGPDLVVVAASAPEAYDLGRELLTTFGRLLAFSSVYPRGETVIDMSHLHRSGQHLLGAVSSDIDDILVVGKIISNELIDLTQVIDGVMPFEQIPEALERALQPNTYRVVLRM